MGDIEKVRRYARQNMPNKPFHNFQHAERVADVASSNSNRPELLRAAGYLHDVKQSSHPQNHEERGAQIAREKLPEWGYTDEEAQTVADAIMGTVLFQTPSTSVGKIMSDADTHNFGLPFQKFKKISLRVKKEENPSATEEEWWTENVIPLLENHSYYVLNQYANQKRANLNRLREEYE